MPATLIVGATRGLGASLAKQYASQPSTVVYATTRTASSPDGFPGHIKWLSSVDLMSPDVGDNLAKQLQGGQPLDHVVRIGSPSGRDGPEFRSTLTAGLAVQIITAGRFITEDFSADKGPKWNDEVVMYTTSSIAPVFIVHKLAHAGLLQSGSKVVLVSSESGSIALRHESEGGGNYAHHASKAALNMVGKLLSLDLKEKGVIVSMVHPGFMRTEMTKGVGFDKYWDAGGGKRPHWSSVWSSLTRDELTKAQSRYTRRGRKEPNGMGRGTRREQVGRVLGAKRAGHVRPHPCEMSSD